MSKANNFKWSYRIHLKGGLHSHYSIELIAYKGEGEITLGEWFGFHTWQRAIYQAYEAIATHEAA